MSLKTLHFISRNLSILSRNNSTSNTSLFYTQQTLYPTPQRYFRNFLFGVSKDNNDKSKTEDKNIEKKETPQENEENSKIQGLKELLSTKETELKDLNKRYLYSLAEIENARKIRTQQVNEARLFAVQSLTRDLLGIADTLESAVRSVKPADLHDASKSFKDLFEGVKMTETNLHKVFSNHGLERVTPLLGEKFDPDYHESVFLMPGEVPGTIGEVRTVGYLLNGRLLRPSSVGVVMENS